VSDGREKRVRYSATSVMMPELTMEEQTALLHRLGFDGIEWRVRRVPEEQRGKGYSEWGEHKNDLTPENFLDNAPHMKQVAGDCRLAIAGIASNAAATDLEQVRLLAQGAQACGAPFLRVGCPKGYDGSQDYNELYEEAVEAYGKAVEVVAGFGVKAALEIHGHTIHPSASLAHRIVSNWDPAHVCVILDANNMVRDGFETTEIALELLGPYLGHVHVGGHRPLDKGRDDVGTVQWEWQGCPLGDGLYDYPRLLRKLKAVDYAGHISVEDFRPAPLEDKLRSAIGYLKSTEG
jgi:sugar phosphate isomerase/epimerase